ncbi:MAG: phosphoribosylformylglycinamidine synthase I [Alphaproteobacteria bacterium]|nr:phosphoribosylformylglycinamidine synthase I [Alphaproteobacteria bacterium]
MNQKPKVLVLRCAGTNCDQETAYAFKACGADVSLEHINRLIKRYVILSDFHILAIPGGFTYGDDIESGRILANELRYYLKDEIIKFIQEKKLIIGICNGFQVLVKAGFLPGVLGENDEQNNLLDQCATLITNDQAIFEDRWVYLQVDGQSPWTKDLKGIVYFPVAHGEGKFITKDEMVLNKLKENGQICFRYVTKKGEKAVYPDNPNGSVDDIAGITDRTGRVLGLMPHPERHFFFHQHPFWTRLERKSEYGDGRKVFENGVDYVRQNLLKKETNLTNKTA